VQPCVWDAQAYIIASKLHDICPYLHSGTNISVKSTPLLSCSSSSFCFFTSVPALDYNDITLARDNLCVVGYHGGALVVVFLSLRNSFRGHFVHHCLEAARYLPLLTTISVKSTQGRVTISPLLANERKSLHFRRSVIICALWISH
jgi:hypothetical protein